MIRPLPFPLNDLITFVRSTFDLSGPGTGIPALSPFSSKNCCYFFSWTFHENHEYISKIIKKLKLRKIQRKMVFYLSNLPSHCLLDPNLKINNLIIWTKLEQSVEWDPRTATDIFYLVFLNQAFFELITIRADFLNNNGFFGRFSKSKTIELSEDI